jgi:hypothetical protein
LTCGSGSNGGIVSVRPFVLATRSSTARASSGLPLRCRYMGDSGIYQRSTTPMSAGMPVTRKITRQASSPQPTAHRASTARAIVPNAQNDSSSTSQRPRRSLGRNSAIIV